MFIMQEEFINRKQHKHTCDITLKLCNNDQLASLCGNLDEKSTTNRTSFTSRNIES